MENDASMTHSVEGMGKKSICDILVCPCCKSYLTESANGLNCSACRKEYAIDQHGYFSFIIDESYDPKQDLQEAYCEHQKEYPIRVYRQFLKKLICAEGSHVLLDVGCGLGTEVLEAQRDGYNAYGVDLPNIAPYWQRNGNDPSMFFTCNAVRIPLRSESFDFVWSLGVIEHIGTMPDTANLKNDYLQARREFATELIRVTKPGGRILLSCPNKAFPIDIHHGPTCGTYFKSIRWFLYNKTKINLHKTWGSYHLLSYKEVSSLFLGNEHVDSVTAIRAIDYFGFNAFRSGCLKAIRFLVKAYIKHLPFFLIPTFLNPYVLMVVRRKE
jgi:SAM-dependent methyltransferase